MQKKKEKKKEIKEKNYQIKSPFFPLHSKCLFFLFSLVVVMLNSGDLDRSLNDD